MPRPSRSIFTRPTGSRSSFSHWITVRPGIDAGSMGTMRDSGSRVSTKPPTWMERWRGSWCSPSTRSASRATRGSCGIETGLGEDGGRLGGPEERRDRIAALDVVLLRVRVTVGPALHRIGLRLRLGAGNHLLTQRVRERPLLGIATADGSGAEEGEVIVALPSLPPSSVHSGLSWV